MISFCSIRRTLHLTLLGVASLLPALGLAANPDRTTFVNPIFEQADPWFTQDGNRYVACFSEGNRAISIHVSDRLTRVGEKKVVWTAPATGLAAREVWAPELLTNWTVAGMSILPLRMATTAITRSGCWNPPGPIRWGRMNCVARFTRVMIRR